MVLPEILKNLAIDVWYKAFISLGGVLFVIALLVDVKGITNGQLQLLASGMFFVGVGEWKNHKVASWFKPPSAYTGGAGFVSGTVRSPDLIGIAFDLIGIVLAVAGVGSIVLAAVRA